MKKLAAALFALVAALTCMAFAACTGSNAGGDENTVAITVAEDYDVEGKTLKDYMDYLVAEDELAYEISDGMIVSLNGKANTTNSYWMLYTSDEANANTAWGTIEYDGHTYGSATLGAPSLPLAEGAVYVWSYQTF